MEYPLRIDLVHLYPKENAEKHHTEKYEFVQLEEDSIPVLRRGMKFSMALSFDRKFDINYDVIRIIFSFGKNIF